MGTMGTLIRRRFFGSIFALAGIVLGLVSLHTMHLHSLSYFEDFSSLGTFIQDIAVREYGTIITTGGSSYASNTTQSNGTVLALSYSLYGSKAKYCVGMINVVKRMKVAFPGWQVWIYHDDTVAPDAMRVLSSPQLSHVKLINVTKEFPHWVHRELNPMAWRFLVASDARVSAYAIRDSDSLPSKRERAAVDEWLRSGKAFHIIRDHPMHNPESFAPILGGMWGGLHRAVPHMDRLLRQHYASQEVGKKRYAEDQDFLWQKIMPLAYNDCLQHDSYYCRESNALAFPVSRKEVGEPYMYVGNVFGPDNKAKYDSRLTRKEYVDKYNTCLEDRRKLEEKLENEGIDFASNVNTTFSGSIVGSSTEAWHAWSKKIRAEKSKNEKRMRNVKIKQSKLTFNKMNATGQRSGPRVHMTATN